MNKYAYFGLVAIFAFCSCAKDDNGVSPVPTNEISLNCKSIEFDVQNIYCSKTISSSGIDPWNKNYSHYDSSSICFTQKYLVDFNTKYIQKSDLKFKYLLSDRESGDRKSYYCNITLSADKTKIDTISYGYSSYYYQGSPGSHSSSGNSFNVQLVNIKPISVNDSVITFDLVHNSTIQGLKGFRLDITNAYSNTRASNSTHEITTGYNSASDSTKFIVRLRYK